MPTPGLGRTSPTNDLAQLVVIAHAIDVQW
jgi:hypothetical protein